LERALFCHDFRKTIVAAEATRLNILFRTPIGGRVESLVTGVFPKSQ
jgi:hypothetical protein